MIRINNCSSSVNVFKIKMRFLSKQNSFDKFWIGKKTQKNFLISKVHGVFQTFYETFFQPLALKSIADTKMESDPSMEAEFHPAGDDLTVGKQVHATEEHVNPVEESNGTNGSAEGPEEAVPPPHAEPEEAQVENEPGKS